MLLEKVNKKSTDLIFVYTTCPNKEEVVSIGLQTINNKLAISADYWLVESIYPWKGVVQEVNQYMLVLSSQKYLEDKLIKFIDKIHSYSTPMIAVCGICKINSPYKFWAEGFFNFGNKYLAKKKRDNKENIEVYNYGKLK